jgi:hypothetical protein
MVNVLAGTTTHHPEPEDEVPELGVVPDPVRTAEEPRVEVPRAAPDHQGRAAR